MVADTLWGEAWFGVVVSGKSTEVPWRWEWQGSVTWSLLWFNRQSWARRFLLFVDSLWKPIRVHRNRQNPTRTKKQLNRIKHSQNYIRTNRTTASRHPTAIWIHKHVTCSVFVSFWWCFLICVYKVILVLGHCVCLDPVCLSVPCLPVPCVLCTLSVCALTVWYGPCLSRR